MYIVAFEVWPAEGHTQDYFNIAAELKADLEKVDGFISVERFESVTAPGKFLSLSFWRDEAAMQTWYTHGRFSDYRIRVASVVRDYDMAKGRPPEGL